MSLLSVNLDMVAALRETRHLGEPDPCQAAVLAEIAGADGIAVQLMRNRKHIRDRDLYLLRGVVKTKLTIEISPADELIEKAIEVKPWMVTFVADHADSSSPVSPIDFNSVTADFGDLAARFKGVAVNVCYFVEPEQDSVKGAARNGASAVLLDCSRYSDARSIDEAQTELDRIDRAANSAVKSNLSVLCGRGLNYKNVRPLVEIGIIDEFVIGYSICARSMLVGIDRAVREMVTQLQYQPISN